MIFSQRGYRGRHSNCLKTVSVNVVRLRDVYFYFVFPYFKYTGTAGPFIKLHKMISDKNWQLILMKHDSPGNSPVVFLTTNSVLIASRSRWSLYRQLVANQRTENNIMYEKIAERQKIVFKLQHRYNILHDPAELLI